MGSPGGSGWGPREPGDGSSDGMGPPGGSGWRLTGDRGQGQQTGSLGTPGTEAQGVSDCRCREEQGLQCTQRRATDPGALPAGKSSPLSPSLQGLGRL